MRQPGSAGSLERRTVVTLALLGLVVLLDRIALPGLDPQAFPGGKIPLFAHLLTVGIWPWIWGFFVVELCTLIPGLGAAARRGGAEGRRRIDRVALKVGLAFALLQAVRMAKFVDLLSAVRASPLALQPGWSFRLLFVLTATAGSALLVALAQLLSRHGLGNGFSLLCLLDWLLDLQRSVWRPWFRGLRSDFDLPGNEILYQLAALLVLAALLLLYTSSVAGKESLPEPEEGEGDGGEPPPESQAPIPAPVWGVAFPQSLVALLVPPLAVSIIRIGSPHAPEMVGLSRDAFFWLWIGTIGLVMALLCRFTLRLFSGPERLARELPITSAEARARAAALARRFPLSTALLIAGVAGPAVWNHFNPGPWTRILDFVEIAFALAVLADLRSEVRFLRRHGTAARLATLNNVHLAPLLVERLAAAGIPATLQGFRYRALGFAWLSMIRIGVLVPAARLAEAEAVLAAMEVPVV